MDEWLTADGRRDPQVLKVPSNYFLFQHQDEIKFEMTPVMPIASHLEIELTHIVSLTTRPTSSSGVRRIKCLSPVMRQSRMDWKMT